MRDKINYIYSLFEGLDITKNETNRHGEEKCHFTICSKYRSGVNLIQFEILKGEDEIVCELSSTPAQKIPRQKAKLTGTSLVFGSINIEKWEDLDRLL